MSYFPVAQLTPGDLHIKSTVNKANAQSLNRGRVRKLLRTHTTVLNASSTPTNFTGNVLKNAKFWKEKVDCVNRGT